MRIIHVAGARPNFVKIASIMKAFQAHPEIESYLVHTGQHYSTSMSRLFFDELEIPKPDINLEVGSKSHAAQTAEIMIKFEKILLEKNPDYVLVVGDVNSTVACTLVAVKLGIKVIHVEAGLRSYDRTMPEEINRIVTDSLSDYLFVTEPDAITNLKKEGIPENKIYFVGNVMIDTLLHNKAKSDKSDILSRLNISPKGYVTVTLHRPSNVDSDEIMHGILDAFEILEKEVSIIFPMHPRTKKNMEKNGLLARMNGFNNMKIIDPLGYLDFLKLLSNSNVVLTDSGGIQEETTILGIPCLTIRENTERPITISNGTNNLVSVNSDRILKAYRNISVHGVNQSVPPLWDGHAAQRITQILLTSQ